MFLNQNILTIAGGITIGFGFLGVNLFFVVSGYCIHLGNAVHDVKRLNFSLFAIKRMARIYPLYLAVVIFLFCYWGPYRGEWEQNAIDWKNFVGHLFFWHYFGASNSAGMGISIVMWTIALEVQFYLLYALLFPLLRKIGFGRSAAILLLIDVAYHACENLLSDYPLVFWPSRLAPMRFGEWLLGAWLAELHVRGETRRFGSAALFAGVGIIAAGAFVGYTLELGAYGSLDVPAAIGFFLVIGYLLNRESSQRSITRASMHIRAVGRWLGERCYSIYMVHATVLYIGSACIHSYVISAPLPKTILAVALALIISDIVYRAIELPSHRLSRMIGSKTGSAVRSKEAQQGT